MIELRQLDELAVEHREGVVDVGQPPVDAVDAGVLVAELPVLQVTLQRVVRTEAAVAGLPREPLQLAQLRLEVARGGKELGERRCNGHVDECPAYPLLQALEPVRCLALGEGEERPHSIHVDPELQGLHLEDDIDGVEDVGGGKHRGIFFVDTSFRDGAATTAHMLHQAPCRFFGISISHS